MGKTLIKITGIFFILRGLLDIITFLRTGKSPNNFLDIGITWNGESVNLLGFVFAVFILKIGYDLLKFRNSARDWGLLILWWHFIPIFAILIISFILAISSAGSNHLIGIDSIVFKGTDYGLSNNYTISNPWLIFAFCLSINIFIGIQIFVLSSKKNRIYFIAE